jgi:hypothetical protein
MSYYSPCRLKESGLHISDSGLAVKTSKHFNREDYVDATQRGFVKVMGAASFGKSNQQKPLLPPSLLQQTPSSSSNSSASGDEKSSKKRSWFRKKD